MISHRAGEFFAFSEGKYSDYSFNGLYRARIDFDMAQAAEAFIPYLKAEALLKGKYVPQDLDEDDAHYLNCYLDANSSSFGAYLQRQGLAEPVDYDEIHVGSYGDLCTGSIKQHATLRAQGLTEQGNPKPVAE